MVKLTLSVEEEVVAQAKKMAERSGTSVSSMFARWIKALSSGTGPTVRRGRLTRRASGLIRDLDRPDSDVLTDALLDKYGR